MNNKTRFFAELLVIFTLTFLSSVRCVLAGDFAGGNGSSENPYQIANCQQLQNMNLHLDANYVLDSNINCAATATWNEDPDHPGTYLGFAPIGGMNSHSCVGADEGGFICEMADEDPEACTMCHGTWHSASNGTFTGNFNGNNHTIGYLYINHPESSEIGFFGYVVGNDAGTLGEIKNVGLVEANVTGGTNTGILIGYLSKGAVSNCYAAGTVHGGGAAGGLIGILSQTQNTTSCHFSGNVTGTSSEVGGLIGGFFGTNLTNSYSTGTVNGTSNVGGLAGITQGTLTSCFSTSDVTGAAYVGGLAGWINGSADITSCYALGDVSGTDNVGGLVAYMFGGSITKSYSVGTVSGTTYHGGLLGRIPSGSVTVTNSFYNSDTSNGAGSGVGTAKSTEQMKTESTYTDADWDFDETWDMNSDDNSGYPFLQRQTFNTHALVYFAGDNGSVNGTSTQEIVDGENGDSVEAVADEGYHFVNWNDESTDNPRQDTAVTSDISVTANFAEDEEGDSDCSLPHASAYDDECNVTACNSEYVVSNGECVRATCATVRHAATYHAYPVCGAATCESGYRLSGTECVARSYGSPGGSFAPNATASGQNSVSQLQAQIAALNQQITALQQKLAAAGGTQGSGAPGPAGKFIFIRDLKPGDINDDVKYLQQFLNTHGFTLAGSGLGSPGNETKKFGILTKAAVIKFQIVNSIAPAAGFFGPATRGVVNNK